MPLEGFHPACAHVETPRGKPFIKYHKEDVSPIQMQTHLGAGRKNLSFSNLSQSSALSTCSLREDVCREEWGVTVSQGASSWPSQPGLPIGTQQQKPAAHATGPRECKWILVRENLPALSPLAGKVRAGRRVLGGQVTA